MDRVGDQDPVVDVFQTVRNVYHQIATDKGWDEAKLLEIYSSIERPK